MLWEVIIALVVAISLTYLFVALLGWRGPWEGFFAFLAVVFLAIWAGELWIKPVGPFLFGFYWIPVVITGILVALLLAAAGPPRKGKVETISQAKEHNHAIKLAVNYLLWWVLALLAILILLGYAVEITK